MVHRHYSFHISQPINTIPDTSPSDPESLMVKYAYIKVDLFIGVVQLPGGFKTDLRQILQVVQASIEQRWCYYRENNLEPPSPMAFTPLPAEALFWDRDNESKKDKI